MTATLYIVDNSHEVSTVMSGGERIAIELSKQWTASRKVDVIVIGSNLTEALWSQYLDKEQVTFRPVARLKERENLLLSYIKRVLLGTIFALRFRMDETGVNLLYSASDFWPDSLTGLIVYLRNRDRCRWIAGFYLFAPNPLKGFAEKGPWRFPTLRNSIYWLSQKPILLLVRRFASAVFVTSEPDMDHFVTPSRGREKVIVIRGGVDIAPSSASAQPGAETLERPIDAVFVGRLHSQKGILELIDIWKQVNLEIPGARLSVIGVGPLEKEVHQAVLRNSLEEEVELLGFLDGEPKYEVFKQSKLIVHPALYDSGGMAAAEGMAWGLPGVSYDLEALRTYYPRGMVKVPVGDSSGFAHAIVSLLTNDEERLRLGREARELILENWSWEGRAEAIWNSLKAAGLLDKTCPPTEGRPNRG